MNKTFLIELAAGIVLLALLIWLMMSCEGNATNPAHDKKVREEAVAAMIVSGVPPVFDLVALSNFAIAIVGFGGRVVGADLNPMMFDFTETTRDTTTSYFFANMAQGPFIGAVIRNDTLFILRGDSL